MRICRKGRNRTTLHAWKIDCNDLLRGLRHGDGNLHWNYPERIGGQRPDGEQNILILKRNGAAGGTLVQNPRRLPAVINGDEAIARLEIQVPDRFARINEEGLASPDHLVFQGGALDDDGDFMVVLEADTSGPSRPGQEWQSHQGEGHFPQELGQTLHDTPERKRLPLRAFSNYERCEFNNLRGISDNQLSSISPPLSKPIPGKSWRKSPKPHSFGLSCKIVYRRDPFRILVEAVLSEHHHGHTEPPSDLVLRVKALESLLVEKGLVDPAAIDQLVEAYETRIGPRNGAQVIAKAWSDPAFKKWLLDDATAAIASLGFGGRQGEHMKVVENTPAVHNLVVCTLCSCYPWPVLGLPPVWYKSAPYRARAVADPRGVLKEFGTVLADHVEVRVWDSTAEIRYLVLPERPAGTESWSEKELAGLVTRNSMIGVGKAKSPKERS